MSASITTFENTARVPRMANAETCAVTKQRQSACPGTHAQRNAVRHQATDLTVESRPISGRLNYVLNYVSTYLFPYRRYIFLHHLGGEVEVRVDIDPARASIYHVTSIK
jgi:hypothetical protein